MCMVLSFSLFEALLFDFLDRYNSWLNHYLEFLSYEYFIYRLYLDITVLYSCIYFLHNVVLFNNYFILLFSFKKYISVFFSHFSTWAYVWHNLSIPFLFFFFWSPPFSTLIWSFGSDWIHFYVALPSSWTEFLSLQGLLHTPHQLNPNSWNRCMSPSFSLQVTVEKD